MQCKDYFEQCSIYIYMCCLQFLQSYVLSMPYILCHYTSFWCSHLISLFYPVACTWFSIYILLYASTPILLKWYLFVMFLNFYVQLSRYFIVHTFVLSLRSDSMHTYLSHCCCYCMFVLVRNDNIKMFNQSIISGVAYQINKAPIFMLSQAILSIIQCRNRDIKSD